MHDKPAHNEEDTKDRKEILTKRKLDGINITIKEDVEAKRITTFLECVHLIHNALPELRLEEIDTSASFLGHKFSAPLIIDAITGGTQAAEIINSHLSTVAEEKGLGLVVGSQRAMIHDNDLAKTYSVVRENAPTAFVAANIGAPQIAKGFSVDDAKKLVEMIKADALVIHLNPLQELIQPEGEPQLDGVLKGIKELTSKIGVPVVVKEVGAGISREVAMKLELAGVSAINIAGAGGTSWAGIEHYRAEACNVKEKADLGNLFWDWGIPTAVSLIEARRTVRLNLIASGGLRNGVDVAKCIVLGANICGMALPMLRKAAVSQEALRSFIIRTVDEFRATMYLVGARNISELTRARRIITRPLTEWLTSD